ncbi:MAG: hypothetical protein MUW56_04320 [Chryseobacterium sp.]|uniref:hypothetical protein n=1 Tax=Chryseobacterium sp. TaxID=1871047 RepID=UPI0025C34B59|nr:hypothetical protein [Chryseobacterium sp.]MCJ7932860.1 hypothetical protein [Chryseobacterium sp.]
MKNLKYVLLPIICMGFTSCNQQEKKNSESPGIQKESLSGSFDSASLTVGQNINDILKSAGVTVKDTVLTDEVTLIGNERMAFSSGKLLQYNGISLAGKNNKNTNKVLLHYGKVDQEIGPLAHEKNDELGMYQIDIYSEPEKKHFRIT